MPIQKTQSKLMGKLKKAYDQKKGEPVDYGNMELPGGIDGGVAQLVDIFIKKHDKGPNKGKEYFYAAGIVKLPTKLGDIKVEGLRTSITESMFDTPGKTRATEEDHCNWVINEIRKLGGEDCLDGVDDIEDFLKSLKEAAPHFRFSTRKSEPTKEYPNPRTFHNWFGACDEPTGSGDDVVETEAVEETTVDAEPEEEAQSEGVDLAALAEAADGGDADAAEALTAKATEAGVEEDAVTGAENWGAVVAMIEKAVDQTSDEPEAEPEPAIPVKGEVYKYQPTDPKTKKPAVNQKTKKPIKVQVEITVVDKKTSTVTCKNVDDGKTLYKAVPFDNLEAAD